MILGLKLVTCRRECRLQEIHEDFIREKTFIFFGKVLERDNNVVHNILETFDYILPIYLDIMESANNGTINSVVQQDENTLGNFQEIINYPINLTNNSYTSVSKEINIGIRHKEIQYKLYKDLCKKYGDDNVKCEVSIGRSKVDVVVFDSEEYIFFEIKVAANIKSCIRQSLGQILEYSYWPDKKLAKELVIVGEYKNTEESEKYISYLNNQFKLPINYLRIVI